MIPNHYFYYKKKQNKFFDENEWVFIFHSRIFDKTVSNNNKMYSYILRTNGLSNKFFENIDLKEFGYDDTFGWDFNIFLGGVNRP